jgi:hypothetical protein
MALAELEMKEKFEMEKLKMGIVQAESNTKSGSQSEHFDAAKNIRSIFVLSSNSACFSFSNISIFFISSSCFSNSAFLSLSCFSNSNLYQQVTTLHRFGKSVYLRPLFYV